MVFVFGVDMPIFEIMLMLNGLIIAYLILLFYEIMTLKQLKDDIVAELSKGRLASALGKPSIFSKDDDKKSEDKYSFTSGKPSGKAQEKPSESKPSSSFFSDDKERETTI
jgi:hypothetical protein